MARSTVEALIILFFWTAMENLMTLHKTREKVPTTLFRDELKRQYFAGPISSRASRVLGPISCFRAVDTLRHMKLVVCLASWDYGEFLTQLLQWSLYAPKISRRREAQMCRIACPDERDSLSHHNECLLLYNRLYVFGVVLRRFRGEAIFSVTWSFELFLRSVQYGILIICFIDACAFCS